MINRRLVPQNEIIPFASWEEIYVHTKHWQEDLAFYQQELLFLKRMVDRYFIWLEENENVAIAEGLQIDILSTQQKLLRLQSRIEKQLSQLVSFMRNEHVPDETIFRYEQMYLHEQIARFTNEYKVLKRQVFNTSSQLIDEEQLDRVMRK